jgi:hypothetical protein
MAKADLTAQRLREILSYDPDTGLFTRRKWCGGTSRAGSVAGGVTTGGYIQVGVDGTIYKAHRLAWLYVYGEWPKNDIDHINGVPADNRISNLRDVPRKVNNQNRRKSLRGDGALIGTSWRADARKWTAHIKHPNGKNIYLGLFVSEELAHQAYIAAKRRLHEGCTI